MGKVIDDYPGRVHYVEIDVEQDPEIAEGAGVNGTPTVQVGAAEAAQRRGAGCQGPGCRCPLASQAGARGSDAASPARRALPQIFKDKARLHNLPGVKMKREYKALIEQYI